jgi:hypothetical protein
MNFYYITYISEATHKLENHNKLLYSVLQTLMVVNTRALQNVTSSELLTKNMYILKLILNVAITGTEV